MSHDLHTLVGAYALDALDHHEHDDFEQHLATCETCRAEVDELVETAARLGAAVEPADAVPTALRARVLETVARTPQERPVVVPLESRRTRRWLAPVLGAAAALLAVLAISVAVQQLEDNEVDKITVVQARESALIADVLASQDKVAYDKQLSTGLHMTVVRSREVDAAVVSLRDLPPLAEGRSYQMWRISKGADGQTVTSAGVLEPDEVSRARATMLLPDVAGVDAVAVTEEPAGGSPKPTGEPLVQLTLPT